MSVTTADVHRRMSCELCLVGAESRAALERRISELVSALATRDDVDLVDMAYTLAADWSSEQQTVAIVAKSTADLVEKLKYTVERLQSADCTRIKSKRGVFYFAEGSRPSGKLAYLFPGEGSQYANMLREATLHFPEVRKAFDMVDHACQRAGVGFVPSSSIFPPPGSRVPEAELWEMETAIESVSAADMAFRRLFDQLNIRPQAVVGHSSGEFVALDTAGILRFASEEDEIRFVHDGYVHLREMTSRRDIPEGVLLTVGGVGPEVIDELLARHTNDLLMAIENCPHQYVLCAVPRVAENVTAELAAKGAIVYPLPFNRPYHTAWFESTLDGLRELFERHSVHPPQIDIYSCATADRFPEDLDAILDLCVTQWARPVRFQETIERMYEHGVRLFLEVGPRGNLTSFVNDILKGRPHLAVAPDRMNQSGIQQLYHALGLMAAHGVAMDPLPLFSRRSPQRVEPAAAPEPTRPSSPLVLTLSPVFLPSMSTEGIEPIETTTAEAGRGTMAPASADAAAAPPTSDAADPVMSAYFDTMDTFLVAQRELAMRVLGSPSAAGAPPAAPAAPESDGAGRPAGGTMLGQNIECVPWQSLTAIRRFAIDEDVFLKDHAFPGSVLSFEDETLSGLPVMPLTMSLELCGEAAAALCPGKVVVGVRDIRATRWISFESRERTLRITATRLDDAPCSVHVEIRDAAGDGARVRFAPCLVEANVDLADDYPVETGDARADLRNARACDWNTESIYPEFLFHGPALRGIASMTRWGENGVEGAIRVMPRGGLFKSVPNPEFAFDGILLDSAGAMLYLWRDLEGPLKRRAIVLPFRTRHIRFFQPPLPEGSTVRVTLETVSENEMSASANVRVIDDTGHLVMELQEWEARVFRVSPSVHGVFHTPENGFASEEVDTGDDSVTCCLSTELSLDFLGSSHGVWRTMLAYSVFDREDREAWKRLEMDDVSRSQWLLEQAVAKDAVRRHLMRMYGLHAASPDVHTESAGAGRVRVTGTWESALRGPLRVVATHAGHVAAAAVCEEGACAIGLEVRPVDEAQCEPDAEIRGILGRCGATGAEWPLRLEAALAAAEQAMGAEAGGTACQVSSVSPETGRVAVDGAGVSLPVMTDARDHTVIAVCVAKAPA